MISTQRTLFSTFIGLFIQLVLAPYSWGQEAEEGLSDELVLSEQGSGFIDIIMGTGFIGVLLWVSLLFVSMACVWLIIDSFLSIKAKRLMPEELQSAVQEAMQDSDLPKAELTCREGASSLCRILQAGFQNIENGYETIQEAVAVAADLEAEQLMQRVNYLHVIGNLAPMLGLLGTVLGMIFAFASLSMAGSSNASLLALNISQALYTTAAGLLIAVPALAFYYFFRNRANTLILNMEQLTLDTIKVLRHVEVVIEEEPKQEAMLEPLNIEEKPSGLRLKKLCEEEV